MRNMLIATMLVASAPAAAVTVAGISLDPANTATVWTAEPGLLEADVSLSNFSPVIFSLAADAGETGFAFNSMLDFLTGVQSGRLVGNVSLHLTGATWGNIGSVEAAFSNPFHKLSADDRTLTISFPGGEGYGAHLGLSDPFQVEYAADGNLLTLTVLAAAVPEASTWALMITGFGLVGAGMRRRAILRTHA